MNMPVVLLIGMVVSAIAWAALWLTSKAFEYGAEASLYLVSAWLQSAGEAYRHGRKQWHAHRRAALKAADWKPRDVERRAALRIEEAR